ncbi:helix-turn-helix domain-containing protein [Massilia dura]|uniref:Helix-turn-helix domain-containing protein n=1 Tax=Pseudoduganella dura TaxID=321982 RepID=A0A6I3XNB8_9BURK|nr:helix-turn-helix domain-containing protein [Pseudoduganella dura]MUI16060.1 helix-turn-helix domain-containing protein [Pseudoduganella dura]GGY09325.1 hypothetical protein GCM10007386_44680 [Pseudoduganella dura]
MHKFHCKLLAAFVAVLAASIALSFLCLGAGRTRMSLLPPAGDSLRVRLHTYSDNVSGGGSAMSITGTTDISARFRLSPVAERPFAAAEVHFAGSDGQAAHLDISRYTTLSFFARCSPANTLILSIPTFDAKVSKRGDLISYRTPSTHFTCGIEKSLVSIDLTRLETDRWWFDLFRLNPAEHAYTLDQVPKIAFGTSSRSPFDTDSTLEISDLTVAGRDDRYRVLLAALLVMVWSGFLFAAFRAHARALVAVIGAQAAIGIQARNERPSIAYRQVSVDAHKDREKAAVLHFLATRYSDSDLDLETMAAETGVNRNKINDILKAELGQTFVACLNKLRLAEAARLLAEQSGATVAQIAYSVGYNNVSYFNRLFKETYGCTPKAFRNARNEDPGLVQGGQPARDA